MIASRNIEVDLRNDFFAICSGSRWTTYSPRTGDLMSRAPAIWGRCA